MNKTVYLVSLLSFLSISAKALPPVLVPTDLESNNIGGNFPAGSMLNNFQKYEDYLVGQVNGGGAFILNNDNNALSIYNFGASQFAGFGSDRAYINNRYIELSTGNENLLSLANPPSNINSFGISAANGNRVYGSYMGDQINPSTGSRMPYSENFFGVVNTDNSITWTPAPSADSSGSYFFKNLFGNYAYGSYMEYDPVNNPNSSTKGLIYDITTGNKTLLDVPSSFGSRIEAMTDNLVYGTYEFVVSGGSGPGIPGRVLETRGYVYDDDGTNFFTLALNDSSSADGYDYASFRSFSANGNEVVVTNGSGGEYFTGQVPEPSALSLLAFGLGGLAILRRRRS